MNKKVTMLVSITIAVILLFITAVPVLAFEARNGSDVTIGSEETIDGDVYLAGTNIIVDGTINGDLFAAGQNIHVNGTVNGGVTLAGQAVTLNGEVSGGARVAAQAVTVSGKIGRDLLVAASDVTINDSASIGADLNSNSASTIINGQITGNVTGSIASLTISSEIMGNVMVQTGKLTLTPTANIMGNLEYASNNTADIQQGASVKGTTNRTIPEPRKDRETWSAISGVFSFIFRTMAFLSIFIVGLIILAFGRKFVTSLAFMVYDKPVSSLGWGALLFFVTPIAAFIVMLTILGIPLSLVTLFTWGILLYLVQLPIAVLIGWMILSRKRAAFSYGFSVGMMALGLAILYILGAIPVFGGILWLAVMIFGLGSLIAILRHRYNSVGTAPMP